MTSSEDQRAPFKIEDLQQILEHLQLLIEPSEMPQAIRLCKTALRLVSRDSHAELWAWLQFQLGSSCIQNSLGNRAQNLERAIEHSKLALQVYIREDFPEQWA